MLAGAARASASAGAYRRGVALMRRAIAARATREGSQARGSRAASDRLVLGAMHEELGRIQSAGGDPEEAMGSLDRALAILPPGPSLERARAQATLAQLRMLEGDFTGSATVAMQVAETLEASRGDTPDGRSADAGREALAIRGHATCTLGVDSAYLGRLDEGLALLEDATTMAREAGRLDDLMRAAANRTLLLDMDARREAAIEVVEASLSDAAAGGMAATYGAMLGGNAADILFQLGRWSEAEAACRAALEWRPRRHEAAWYQPLLVLGLLLTESRADEEAERLVGQTLLQLETVPAGQWSGLVLRSAISLAIWQGDPDAALAIAEEDWPRVLETDEVALIAAAASACLEAAAAAAERGRESNDAGLVSRARELADLVIPDVEARVADWRVDATVGATPRGRPPPRDREGPPSPRPGSPERRSVAPPRERLARARRALPRGQGAPVADPRRSSRRRPTSIGRPCGRRRGTRSPRPIGSLSSCRPCRCSGSSWTSRSGLGSRFQPRTPRWSRSSPTARSSPSARAASDSLSDAEPVAATGSASRSRPPRIRIGPTGPSSTDTGTWSMAARPVARPTAVLACRPSPWRPTRSRARSTSSSSRRSTRAAAIHTA